MKVTWMFFAAALLCLAPFFCSRAIAEETGWPGGRWEPGPAKYGAVVADNIFITMDDGVKLEAVVAWPAELGTKKRAAGKFPVIVEHTPYVRLGADIRPNTYFTEHGYIYAVVRVRGMGASGGDVQFFSPRDGEDGRNIVKWAAERLEGSDGRIALIGCSYPGIMAFVDCAAVGKDSPVKAIISASNGLEGVNRQSFMVGGLPTTGFWNYTVHGLKMWGGSASGEKFLKDYTTQVIEGKDAAYDGEFWKERAPIELARRVVDNGIPLLLWTGWQDIVDYSAIRSYAALQNAFAGRPLSAPAAAGQPFSPKYQIVIGNWRHAVGLNSGIFLQWIETWLKGADTGLQKVKKPMHLYETGSERWLNVAGFPTVSSYTPLYLNCEGGLQRDIPAAAGASRLDWTRPDKENGRLSFVTPAFDAGATLSGPISAVIYASSSNTNMVLIAKLYDVAPDGGETCVTKGAVLGSQRELDEERSWRDDSGVVVWPWPKLQEDSYLRRGEVYRLDISLAPRQWGVRPNHRLRFELTAQNPENIAPDDGVPPENGTDPCRLVGEQRSTVPGGKYRIMAGAKYPSALNLPLLPWEHFPAAASGVVPAEWSEHHRQIVNSYMTLPLEWGKE